MLIYQFALFSVTGAGINLFSACGYVSQSFRICSLFKQFYFLELVRKIEISLPRLEEYVIAYYDAVPVGIWCIQEVVAVGHGGKSCAVNSVFCNP